MSWQLTKLSHFLNERKGRIKHSDANKLGLQRIKKIDFSGNIHLERETDTKTDMILVKSGDLVVSGINASKGAIAVHELEEDVLATIHYSSYEFNPDLISVDYLKWFFKSPKFSELLKEQVPGGIKTELKPKHILPLQVQLPKLAEQINLAKQLNKFHHQQLKLEFEIKHQTVLASKLKEIVLEEAIHGGLTKEWRNANPNLENSKKLLEKIYLKKLELVREKKIKKQEIVPQIDISEVPYEILDGWTWCRFSELGIVSPRNHVCDDTEISFFPMSAISADYEKKIYAEKRIWREVKKGFTHVANGDVALAKITPCFENGKAAIFNELINGVGAATTELHVLRPILVNPEYLLIFLKSPSYVKNGIPRMTGTAGQKRIPTEYFSNALIPLPPLAEQFVIVERVRELMEASDLIGREIASTKALASDLSDSILKDAFSPSA
jgi:type I restriction enzyme S subunit